MTTATPKIAINLLVRNDMELLQPCLYSLLNSDITNYQYKLFCIDNNSTDSSDKFIENLPCRICFQRNATNEGIVKPRIDNMNKIIEEGYDYALEIHADMLFPKVWITPLIEHMDDNTAITMPYILNNPSRYLTVNELENIIPNHSKNMVVLNVRQVHPWLLNVKIVKKIGYYDMFYNPIYCEDDDFMMNVKRNGYMTKACKKSIVAHYGGQTRKDDIMINNEAFNKRLQYFYSKFGLSIDDMVKTFTLHPIILDY